MKENQIFLYGYHGFRNIGAEARLVSIMEHLRREFPRARFLVSTWDRHSMNFLRDLDPNVELAYINPANYRWGARKYIASSRMMVLCEGNMLTERFSPLMVNTFWTAMKQARQYETMTMGIALDSGTIAPRKQPGVARELDSLEALTLRTPAAADELKSMGVRRNLQVTADCALSMLVPSASMQNEMAEKFRFQGRVVHALAPVDFYMWPAKISFVGTRGSYLRYPIKLTWGEGEGRADSQRLVADWTAYANSLLADDESALLALTVMDPADGVIASEIAKGIRDRDRVVMLSGAELTTHQMAAAFSSFATMTTSRYHALVVGMTYGVPFVSLHHDTRMRFIADELGLGDLCVPFAAPDRVAQLREAHAQVLASSDDIRRRISKGVERMRSDDARNYAILAELARKAGIR